MNDLIPGTRVEGRSCTTARTCTPRTSTRSRSGGGSGWSSRRRTRSRSRSTTTSRSGRGSTASRATSTSSSSRACGGPPLGRGQGQAQAVRPGAVGRPAAAPVHRPGDRHRAPRSSSWTSRAPRSIRAATLQIEELMAELKKRYTIVIVTHNMQQAARASDRTVFMNMAEDRAGYVVEQGRHDRDLHQPEEPADRGLRVRPVRLSEERTHDRARARHGRAERRPSTSSLADRARRRARRDLDRRRRPRASRSIARSSEIKDDVLRMGSLVEDAIRAAIAALVDPRRRRRARGHQGRRLDQRGAARGVTR